MKPLQPCGVLNLDKPTGMTSRAAVDRVTRIFGRGVKVGHAGTLDPLASGVLVICVGAATRLIAYVQAQTKTYQTVVLLGARSNTLDADGLVEVVEGAAAPRLEDVRAAAARQVGTIMQLPPDFSALRIQGKRAYDLARAGKAVELAPRPVTIHRVEVTEYRWPRLSLEIECGGGTYIRSIARDVGEELGCGGLVEVLIRSRIGGFTRETAHDPTTLTPESLPGLLLPASEAVTALPALGLNERQVVDVSRGKAIEVAAAADMEGELALFAPDGSLVAVGETSAASVLVAPRRVLVGSG